MDRPLRLETRRAPNLRGRRVGVGRHARASDGGCGHAINTSAERPAKCNQGALAVDLNDALALGIDPDGRLSLALDDLDQTVLNPADLHDGIFRRLHADFIDALPHRRLPRQLRCVEFAVRPWLEASEFISDRQRRSNRTFSSETLPAQVLQRTHGGNDDSQLPQWRLTTMAAHDSTTSYIEAPSNSSASARLQLRAAISDSISVAKLAATSGDSTERHSDDGGSLATALPVGALREPPSSCGWCGVDSICVLFIGL